jgi:DNA-binding NarL/FixJ family response regulator
MHQMWAFWLGLRLATPGFDGLEVLQALRREHPALAMLMLNTRRDSIPVSARAKTGPGLALLVSSNLQR